VYSIAVLKSRKNLRKKKTWAKKFFLKNNVINSKINSINKPLNFTNLKFSLNDFF
jgi:hypothetical protein